MERRGVREHGTTPRYSGTNPDWDEVYETRFFTVLGLLWSRELATFLPFTMQISK
ncbi:MAG: hypothetical protein ACRCUY_04300 [Thermoguttaceae bacterium]